MRVSLQTSDYIGNKRDYKPSFKRVLSEHLSWGAKYIKETEKTNFKLFSFPDAKAVFVEIADKTSVNLDWIKSRIVKVIGTAGLGLAINNILPKNEQSRVFQMENKGNGIFEAKNIDAKPDDKYRYVIITKNNDINLVKDPYAKKQEDINGWSSIYQSDYEWQNKDWLNGKDERRIIRKPNEKLRGLDRLIIDEVNIPTLSDEGTFDAAKKHIDKIAEYGIATAVELLPVENTFSLQWGYDGVDKFAVNEKMGGADKLKELIDYIHGKGLNVIMDMVPNHMGPDGDYLTQTGPYEKGSGEFGGEFNYEKQNNRYVRDWMSNAALWWANEFKVDGLRLDMTKMCGSDYLLKQIVTEVNEHAPGVFIIAEDGRENKESVTRYETNSAPHEDILNFIDTQIDFITRMNWRSSPVFIGFDSEWDFRLMHTLKNALINSSPSLLEDLNERINNSQYRVKYIMSHDEIGNIDGTRLIPKIISNQLFLFGKVNGINDAEKGQNAAHAGQKLANLVISENFENIKAQELINFEKSIGITEPIQKELLINAFNTALAKQKLGLGTILTIPGPKMFFQGDEYGDLSYFKFFREFSNEKDERAKYSDYATNIIRKKGYDTLESIARKDSIVGKTKHAGLFKNLETQLLKFNTDLKTIFNNLEVLRKGDIVGSYKDFYNNIHTHHLKYNDQELIIIKNFGEGFHNKTYCFDGFPINSTWKEIFNSDSTEYGGAGYINNARNNITKENQYLSIAPNSFIILQKV